MMRWTSQPPAILANEVRIKHRIKFLLEEKIERKKRNFIIMKKMLRMTLKPMNLILKKLPLLI